MIKTVITFNDGSIFIHKDNVKSSSEVFEPGFYKASSTGDSLGIKTVVLGEDHPPLPIKEFSDVFNYTVRFFDTELKQKVNKLGFKHKLGVLLYGKPGTGKTSFCTFLCRNLVENYGGICLLADDKESLGGALSLVESIREVQDNPIIIFSDEFERWSSHYESEMKNFLDGINSIDNCIFLACTNYIDKVPDSLKNRPSRFKGVYEVGGIDDPKVIHHIISEKSEIIELYTKEEIDILSEELSKERPTLDSIKNIILDKIINEEMGLLNTTKFGKVGFKNETKGTKENKEGFFFSFDVTSPTDVKKTVSNI